MINCAYFGCVSITSEISHTFIRCLIRCISQLVKVTLECIGKKLEWNEKMARYVDFSSICLFISFSFSVTINIHLLCWKTLNLRHAGILSTSWQKVCHILYTCSLSPVPLCVMTNVSFNFLTVTGFIFVF